MIYAWLLILNSFNLLVFTILKIVTNSKNSCYAAKIL